MELKKQKNQNSHKMRCKKTNGFFTINNMNMESISLVPEKL